MQLHHQQATTYQKITLLFKRASPAYQVDLESLNLQMMLVDLRYQ
jgi:hypothetical protein